MFCVRKNEEEHPGEEDEDDLCDLSDREDDLDQAEEEDESDMEVNDDDVMADQGSCIEFEADEEAEKELIQGYSEYYVICE